MIIIFHLFLLIVSISINLKATNLSHQNKTIMILMPSILDLISLIGIQINKHLKADLKMMLDLVI